VREIVSAALSKDTRNDQHLRDYAYVEKITEREGQGAVRTRTYEVVSLYGQPYRRLVQKDGRPLDASEARKEDQHLAKVTAERRKKTPQERAKRQSEYAKAREKQRAFLKEIPAAYDLRLVGSEPIGGSEAWVVEAVPRRGYKPVDSRAKILQKFKGKFWIDKSESQVVRVEAEAIDDVSVGLVLARLHKGSRFEFALTRLSEGIWAPSRVAFRVNARIALLKSFHTDRETVFQDYRRFQADSQVVSTSEISQ
jgi:hypothetical protein